MARSRYLAALTALLAVGCVVGPDYQRPEVDAPVALLHQPSDATGSVDVEWWRKLGDPALDDLIVEALANNRSVKVAVANVEQAAALLTQTRSGLFPQIGYGANAERSRSSESGANPALAGILQNPQNVYQAVLNATWELDLWGRIARLSESARANLFATDEARRGVILSVVAAVATSYVQLRGLDEQLVVARSTLATYGESLRLFQLQFKYGQVSQMNVAQAASQYETAAARIPQIETQIAQTENALSVLLGRNPSAIARGKTIYEMTLPEVPSGLPSSLLSRRPDLLQSEQGLIAANAQIGAARALYFPTISLTGAFGASSAELSNLFKGPARVWSYAGQVAGPIFTFGAISGQVRQAEAAQRAALESYRLAIENAFSDVDNALVAHEKLKNQLAAQERLVASLREYARLARLQYSGGYAPYSTVLQAEQALFPAEIDLAGIRASLYVSIVNLYRSMGGGWVTLADRMTPTATDMPSPDGRPPLF